MSSQWPKPKGLGPEYGAQFGDRSVVEAYPTRPPYPLEVFDLLRGLMRDASPRVLDLGCGTGDISRGLAPHGIRMDAVVRSAAMLARAQTLPGGQHPNIHWIASTAEDYSYPNAYALVVCAESLHCMDWYVVLPSIQRSLTAQGRLAIVLGRGFRDEPWRNDLQRLITQYSTNREFERYNLLTELTNRKLFQLEQSLQTQPVAFSQTVDAYIESFHSRNGLSRDRMGSSATMFDEELKTIIGRYRSEDVLQFELVAELAWRIPIAD